MKRFRSEDEYRNAVEQRAKQIWDDAERRMWGDGPHFAKQSWDEGTDLARAKARECAVAQLAFVPAR